MTSVRNFAGRGAALILFLTAMTLVSGAQVTFGGAQRTFATAPAILQGVAVDASGNVLILTTGFDNGSLTRISPDGTSTTLASGLPETQGIAVDASGNAYISDSVADSITKITPTGTKTTFASGISDPTALAVDASGNVDVIVGGAPPEIVRFAPGGGSTVVGTGGYTLGSAGGGLWLDGAGDLFVADTASKRILEVSIGGTTSLVSTGSLSNPKGVAMDAAGDLFIADYNGGLVEEPAGGGAQQDLGSGLSQLIGVAVNAAGHVFVADSSDRQVDEIQLGLFNFGAVNLGSVSATWSLIYNFGGSETLTAAGVVTQGAAGLDFAPVSTGTTCTAGTFGTGTNQCVLNANFTPRQAGVRLGAATLSTNAGTLITTYLGGTGAGPEIGFDPGSGSVTAISGAGNPLGAAEDASGNVYVADDSAAKVYKITPGGTQTPVGSGLSGPEDVAVDGAGNVYIADTFGGDVVKVPLDGSAQSTVGNSITPVSVAVDGAGNVYIGGDGGYGSTTEVVKVAPNGIQTTVVAEGTTIAGSTIDGAYSLALDAAGDLYIADGNNGRVVKVPAGGGTASVVASGLEQPAGVAVDAAGNLYIADSDHNQIVEVPAGGGSAITLVSNAASFGSPGTALRIPFGLTIDGAGNLVVVDNQNKRLVKLDRQDAPSLSFASTSYGATSAAQTVAVNNIGNASLTFTGLSVASGFVQQTSGGTDCSATAVVAVGASCALQLALQPNALGTTSGSASLTDNSGNTVGGVQTVNLSGAGAVATLTPSLTGTVSKTYDGTTAAALTAANYSLAGQVGSDNVGINMPTSGTYDTAAVGTGKTVTVSGLALTGTAAPNYQLAATSVGGAVGTITPAPLTVTATPASMVYGSSVPGLTPSYSGFVAGDTATVLSGAPSLRTLATSSSNAGTYAITVGPGTLAAANYSFAVANGTLTITPATQTITFAPIPAQTSLASAVALNATASSGLPVSFRVVSGPAAVSGAVLTLSGSGAVTVEADQSGNGNYQAAAAVQQTFQVAAGPGAVLAPGSLPFGTELLGAASAAQVVTLSNPGAAALTIGTITSTGDFTQTNNCPSSLAANASCAIAVSFTPTATGSRSGVLAVTDNAPVSSQTVALSGTGVNLNLALAGGSGISTINAGGAAEYALTLTPGSYSGTVQLVCSGAPANATCVVNPSSVNLVANAAPIPVTVTVTTIARSTAPPLGVPPDRPNWPWLLALALLPLGLGFLYDRRARSRVYGVHGVHGVHGPVHGWLAGGVLGLALLAAGCGGVNNLPTAGGGTPGGAYTLRVSVVPGSEAQSVILHLNVN